MSQEHAAEELRRSQFFWRLIGLCALGIVALMGVTLQQRHAFCDEQVERRSDQRSVWLYLLEARTGDPNASEVREFRAFLNDRLPPLECSRLGTPKEVPA